MLRTSWLVNSSINSNSCFFLLKHTNCKSQSIHQVYSSLLQQTRARQAFERERCIYTHHLYIKYTHLDGVFAASGGPRGVSARIAHGNCKCGGSHVSVSFLHLVQQRYSCRRTYTRVVVEAGTENSTRLALRYSNNWVSNQSKGMNNCSLYLIIIFYFIMINGTYNASP